MTRFVSTSRALFCFLALFAMFAFIGCSDNKTGLGTPPPKFNCLGQEPNKIVKAMYDIIEYKGYTAQEWQFNITAVASNPPTIPKAEVRIIGWSGNKLQILQALADPNLVEGCTVKDANFEISPLDFDHTPPYPGPSGTPVPPLRVGCPPNYTACGDICIPSGEPCRVTTGAAAGPSKITCTAPTEQTAPSVTPSKSPESK